MTVQNPKPYPRASSHPNHGSRRWFGTFATACIISFTLLTLMALAAHLCSASYVESVSVRNVIADDGSVTEDVQVILQNNSLPSITFSLPAGSDQIDVNGQGVRKQNGSVLIPLGCVSCNFSVRYHIPSVVSDLGGNYRSFSRTLNLPQTPDTLHYEIALPPGSVINAKDSADPPIVPASSAITTDGTVIIVSWNEHAPSLPQNFMLSFRAGENTDNLWAEISTESGEWMVWTIACIALLVGFALGMLIYRNYFIRFDEKSLPYIPASLLSPDEKTILKTLKEHHGHLTQKELGKTLNWSKSKVSAIMTGLERKEIVKREKVGRNFRLEVVKEIEL